MMPTQKQAGGVPVLRRQARQTRQGHHRNPGGGAAAMEGGADDAREVHLPPLREDHPAAGTLPNIARGRAGASLLAMILYAKYRHHQRLNRQSESFAREGIELVSPCLRTRALLTKQS